MHYQSFLQLRNHACLRHVLPTHSWRWKREFFLLNKQGCFGRTYIYIPIWWVFSGGCGNTHGLWAAQDFHLPSNLIPAGFGHKCFRRALPKTHPRSKSLYWHQGTGLLRGGTAQIRPDRVNIPCRQIRDPDTLSTCAKSVLCSRKLRRIDPADAVLVLVPAQMVLIRQGAGLELSAE